MTYNWWKLPRLAKILPPIHFPQIRSIPFPAAWIRILLAVSRCISCSMRVVIPCNKDDPPVTTMLLINAGRISGSQAASEERIISGREKAGGIFKVGGSGVKRVLAALYRGKAWTVLDPSGNSKILLGLAKLRISFRWERSITGYRSGHQAHSNILLSCYVGCVPVGMRAKNP